MICSLGYLLQGHESIEKDIQMMIRYIEIGSDEWGLK